MRKSHFFWVSAVQTKANETDGANFWIEVTSGMRWERLLKEGVTLMAPNTTRYRHFFEGMKSGDFVLHYLTASLTSQKEKRSSVVGVSLVASDPALVEKKIVAGCSNTLELPKPISCNELRGLKQKSTLLRKLVEFSMQRYLTRISRSDFGLVIDAHPANKRRFSKTPLARQLQTRSENRGQEPPQRRTPK